MKSALMTWNILSVTFVALAWSLTATVSAQVVYEADFSDATTFPGGGTDPYVPLELNGFSSEDISLTNFGTATDARWTNNSPDRGFAETVNRNATAVVADGGSYSSTVDFTFDIDSLIISGGPVLQSNIFNGDSTTSDRLAMSLLRNNSTPGKFRINLTTNWGSAYPVGIGYQQSGSTTETSLGLNFNSGGTQDFASDLLRLTTTLTAGADTDSWIATGMLTNLDTNTPLLSYTVNDVPFDAPVGSSIYGGFGTGQAGSNPKVSNREISKFQFDAAAPTTPADWTQLKNDVISKKNQLDNLVNQANTAGINTDYAGVSQVVLNRFLTYAQFDRDNPDKIETAVNDLWWNSKVPANYHQTLPFQELEDAKVVADRAIAELQSQIAGTTNLQAPVDFSTGSMTQGDGYFFKDGKPVFPSSFTWMPDEADALEAFGNIGGTYYSPNELNTDGTIKPWAINGDVATLTAQNANNQAPQVFFLGYNLATWMEENHPEVLEGGRNFVPFDTDSPLVRQWYTQLFEGNLPTTTAASGSTPRLHLLANEPHFATREGGWLSENGVSSNTLGKYRTWLETKYGGDIATLNSTYGTSHANFDAARSAMQLPIATSLQGGAIWYDWSRFNMDRVNDWFTFVANGVKANDVGNAQTTIKILGGQLTEDWRDHGMDLEYLINLQDVLGSDFKLGSANLTNINLKPEDLEWQDRYTLNWAEQSMGLDFAKSLAPDKPFYDSEWHGLDTGKWRDFDLDPDYVRSALWLAYTHGVSGTKSWVWGREEDGDFETVNSSFVGEVLTQPKALNAYGRAFKELNAHSESVAALASGERQFLIFYTEDSAIQDLEYTDQLQAVYEALKMLNIPVGFTTATNIGGLDAGQTVIIPPTEFISDETLAALQNFAGNIVLVDPAGNFTKTEHGVARAASGLSSFGTIALDDVFSMADAFDSVLDPLTMPPLIEVNFMNTDLQSAYGVLMKQALDAETGEVTLSLINVSTDPRWASFVLPDGVDSLVDLITGMPVAESLLLDPYDVLLLRSVLASLAGDFDGDGDVDADDIDFYSGKLGQPAEGELAKLDLDGDGTITLDDHNQHVTQLVQTSNGEVGALLGDFNLDGQVDVLGDAATLVENLGNAVTRWSLGDLNADQTVDVLGDAAALVNNLGNSNAGGGVATNASAVPEPGSLILLALACLGGFVRRQRAD